MVTVTWGSLCDADLATKGVGIKPWSKSLSERVKKGFSRLVNAILTIIMAMCRKRVRHRAAAHGEPRGSDLANSTCAGRSRPRRHGCGLRNDANCHPTTAHRNPANGHCIAVAAATTAQTSAAIDRARQPAASGGGRAATRFRARPGDRRAAARASARASAGTGQLRPADRIRSAACDGAAGRTAHARGLATGDHLALRWRRLRARRLFLPRPEEPSDASPPLRSQEP
jgi:hypothetical protein